MTDINNRDERQETGQEAERKLKAALMWRGILYRNTGQENWLPAWAHKKIRFKYDDDIEFIRHIPDIATQNIFIQIKHAPNEKDYKTVTIEQASYRASMRWHNLGVPVLVVWLFQDRKSFFGQWVDKITVIEPDTAREDLNGSKTPMYKVPKDELEPIDNFWKMM